MVSALKFKGERLYSLARRGIDVPRKPRKVKIHYIKLVDFDLPHIRFIVRCSKGTYIRKLGEDVGNILGCGGFISKIRRIAVGDFNIKEALRPQDIDESHLRNWQD
jgi:tRNA pseudouridine55 synthase